MNKTTWDVIVVGSGPGGSVAAKVCAKAGLETILLEKKALPRDKVCSGMVMGRWANDLVREHFGEIPKEVLNAQGHYVGVAVHVGAEAVGEIPAFIPVGWRKNLDYWMCQKALEAGAEVKDNARVANIREHEKGYALEVKVGKETETINARCIIGADGALSAVRKSVWPELKVQYKPAYRECYDASLSIDKGWFRWFFPYGTHSPRFDICFKDQFLLIEGGGIRQIRQPMNRILEGYGFPRDAKPLWRDGCVNPILYAELFSGTFIPAKKNVLLAGDAAGMLFPFTQEGIGSALRSGVLAGEAVIEALRTNSTAGEHYLRNIQGLKMYLKELFSLQQAMVDIAKKGPDALAEAMRQFIEKTVKEAAG